jgi:phospholipid transport system substrate-binding protein
MMSRRALLQTAAAMLIVTATAHAASGAASALIRRLGDDVLRVLDDPEISRADRIGRLHVLLLEYFDRDAIADFVLGRHLRAATPEQRLAFRDVFSDLLLRSYAERLGEYAGEGFVVITERVVVPGEAMVRSRIDRPGRADLFVDWRVRETSGTHRIVDVVIDGLSLAIMRRDEYSSIIRREGLDDLIAKLRVKAARG